MVLQSSLLKFFLGKACFLCEQDGKERELIDSAHQKCMHCTPAVPLRKSGQRVLEHMGGHILFDPSVDCSLEPCGLCLRPSPLCIFYLKKCKGIQAGDQIN